MAAGNFRGDNRDELAIGMPYSDRYGRASGEVVVVSFNPNGNTYQSPYYQSLPNIPGSSKRIDQFGHSVAAADFNGDGYDDLAIGIPAKYGAKWGFDAPASGEVVILQGARNNLYRAQRFNQASPGIEGGTEDFDFFGKTLSSGDFNNDGYPDLLVGVQLEDLGSTKNVGVVQMIWGHPLAVLTPSVPGQQLFHQGSFSGTGFGSFENEVMDQFGSALLP